MKRLVFFALVLGLFSQESFAQMQKGTWILEGNVGLSSGEPTESNSLVELGLKTGYTLNPKAGIFLNDRLVLGFSGLFGNTWNKNDGNTDLPYAVEKTNMFRYGGGVFVRNYFVVKENFSFFGEIGSTLSWQKYQVRYTNTSDNTETDYSRNFQVQGTLGIQYLISSKVGVHLQTNLLQYNYTQLYPGFGLDTSEFQAGFMHNPSIGLTIFL